MLNQNINYRSFLKEVLAERTRKNPSYSLRAFAKQVGLASSTLCEVLKGKGNLSLDSAQRIVARLGLPDADAEYFRLLVQMESAKSVEAKEALLAQLKKASPHQKIHDLSLDHFRAIADWYHAAILELTYLDGFRLSPLTAARKLGITATEAELAIERLLRLELLEKSPDGRLRKSVEYVQAASSAPNEAIRKFYKQTLEKTIEAIDSQLPSEKLSGCETIPIDPERLPEAAAIMERFFSEMLELSRTSSRKKAVYHLGVHFFNLTHERK